MMASWKGTPVIQLLPLLAALSAGSAMAADPAPSPDPRPPWAERAIAAITARDSAALLLTVKEAGAPGARSAAGAMVLQQAIIYKAVEAIRPLLDGGADPNAPREGKGTPLMLAAGNGMLDVMRLLIDRGARPNVVTPEGSALTMAAGAGQLEAVRALLAVGADPDARGAFALVAAASSGDLAIVQELLARTGKRAGAAQALEHAIAWQNPEMTAALLSAGAPLPADRAQRRAAERLARRADGRPEPTVAELRRPVRAAWDGPLLIGSGVDAYLLEECKRGVEEKRGDPARWEDVDLPTSSLGRATGDEVTVLAADGGAASARLGKLTCSIGECGGGWYVVQLLGVRGSAVAVAPPRFVPAGGRVHALRSEELPCPRHRPAAPAARMKPTCSIFSGEGDIAVELLEYDDPIDEVGMGYFRAVAFARLAGGSEPPGPWAKLGDGWQQDVLTPVLAIEAPDAPARILFRRPGGLGDTVLQVGRIAAGRRFELGRSFAAGGQPCD